MPAQLPVVLASVHSARTPHAHRPEESPRHAFQPYGASLSHAPSSPTLSLSCIGHGVASSCKANHPQPSSRRSAHDSRFMLQPVCRHRTHMLRLCCHGGLLPGRVQPVYAQLCVPLRVRSHTQSSACESSSHPTADREPVCHRRILARPVLTRQRQWSTRCPQPDLI